MAEVLNQYQRRSDLIPNLVETAKGFAKQEITVMEAVTAARSQATSIQAVRVYNTELKTLPGRIWAAIFYTRNKPMEEFTVDDSVKRPPQVKFS